MTTDPRPEGRAFLQRIRDVLMRRVFGRDLFFSYSRRDATEYVRALLTKVREDRPELSICVDQWAARPHDTTHPLLLREARRSSLFVLVASTNAMKSSNVAGEIDEFLKTGRYLLAIDVDGALASPDSVWSEKAKRAIGTTAPVDETGDKLDPKNPDPSPNVVTRLLGAVTFETQTQRNRRDAIRVLVAVAAIVAGAWAYTQLLVHGANDDIALGDATRRFADARANRASRVAIAANAAAADAAIRAVTADATALASEARAIDANARAGAAEERAVLAGVEAKNQQEIALALQLANESAILLQQQPHLVERSVQYAAEAMARLDRRGVRALSADQALRASVPLLPRFERNDRIQGTLGQGGLSPGGDWLVVTDDTEILLYDVDTGRCDPLPVEGHGPSRGWSTVVFDRGGSTVAAALREDGPGRAWVHVWDLKTRKPLGQPLRFDDAYVEAVALGAGGTIIAVATDSRYMVADPVTHERLDGGDHGDAIRWLEFSPDDRLLVTVGSSDVRIRDWKRKTEAAVIDTKDPTSFATFAPKGSRIATVDDKDGLVMWDFGAKPAKRLWAADMRPPYSHVAFTPDGSGIGVSRDHGRRGLRVYETDSGQTRTSIDTSAQRFAFNADASLIATGAVQIARLWRAADGRELGRAPHPSVVPDVAIRDDGRIVSAAKGERLRVWHRNEQLRLGSFVSTQGEPEAIAFEPGTGRLAIATDPLLGIGAELYRMDADGQSRRCRALSPAQNAMVFSADGILITGGRDGKVRAWNDWCSEASQPQVIDEMKVHGAITSIAISSDGANLMITSGKIARVIEDWRGAKRIRDLTHTTRVFSCAFFPNGDLATGGEDGVVRIWRKGVLRELKHGPRVLSLAVDRTGRFLAAAGHASDAHVWNLASERTQPVALPHDLAVWSVAFDPTGRYLATASSDGMAHVWTGWEQGVPRDVVRVELGGGATLVAFSSDGKWLASLTNAADPYTVITPWRPPELIDAACRSLGTSRPIACGEMTTHVIMRR